MVLTGLSVASVLAPVFAKHLNLTAGLAASFTVHFRIFTLAIAVAKLLAKMKAMNHVSEPDTCYFVQLL